MYFPAMLKMDEISMIVNEADCSVNSQSKRLQNLLASKCSSKPGLTQNSFGSSASSSVYTLSGAQNKNVFQKSSQLPLYRGSNVSRSFPKVADSDKSLLKHESKSKDLSVDMETRKGSFEEVEPDPKLIEEALVEIQSHDSNARKSDQSEISDDIWSSPNTSNCLPAKLDNFKFSANDNLAEEFRKKFKILSNASAAAEQGDSLVYDDFAKKDRERTPPPDGQSGKEKAKLVTDKGFSRRFSENSPNVDPSIHNMKSAHTIGNQPDIIPGQGLLRNSPVYDKKLLENDSERSRLDTSAVDHGYMPGHHIPDGTEYSQRSDYAHINHKGELREDVAGMDDVGLVESRGFDMLRNQKSCTRNTDDNFMDSHKNSTNFTSDKNRNKLDVNLQPTQSKSPMIKPPTKMQDSVQVVSDKADECQRKFTEDLHNVDTQTDKHTKKLESWTQTSFVLNQNEENQTDDIVTKAPNLTLGNDNNSHIDDHVTTSISGIPPKVPVSSFKHNLLPNSQSTVPEKPHLLTKQSLMQTGFAQDNLRRDYSVEVMDRIYSRNSVSSHGNFHTMNATSDEMNFISQNRESLESHREWQVMHGRETLDTIGQYLFTFNQINGILIIMPH